MTVDMNMKSMEQLYFCDFKVVHNDEYYEFFGLAVC